MTPRGWCVLLATALVGCQGCFSNTAHDGGIDVTQIVDAPAARDTQTTHGDTLPVPAWGAGSLVLTRQSVPAAPLNACGMAHALLGTSLDAHQTCVRDNYLYFSLGVPAGRIQLPDSMNVFEALTPPSADYVYLSGWIGCQSDAVVLAAHCARCQAEALVQFADVTQPGIVRWSNQRGAAPGMTSQGGFLEFAASDQVLAWIYQQPDGPSGLFVSGPHGEAPHVLPTSALILDLHAAQNHLVWSDDGDIMLWTVGTGAPENLTHDAPAQAWPWIDGDRVVWADQRNGPGTLSDPNNPDIYAMDLTTRVPFRVNQDPVDQPAMQYFPVLAGDWVVWMDTRHAADRNPGQYGTADVMEIYGYNWVTRREYPVLTGAIRATFPALIGNDVYFPCSPSPSVGATTSLFTTPLPTP